MEPLFNILSEVRACKICEEFLPLGPRPIVQLNPQAKILIAGQAPGRKVHESGIPFDDASGNRLRDWLGITREVFYDEKQIAIIPMGFCYPGTGKSGDLPPRPECSEAWHNSLLDFLPNLEIKLVIGKYAQDYYFDKNNSTLTELVKAWKNYWPEMVPMPHPSPRNNMWLRNNPWFETDLIPELQKQVSKVLSK